MELTRWKDLGLKWYQSAFHIHTPASSDWQGNKDISPNEFLSALYEQGYRIIAITDHNNANWIDKLNESIVDFNNSIEDKLYCFPGVEVSIRDGVHLLVIFELNTPTIRIHEFLNRIGIYQDDKIDTKRLSNPEYTILSPKLRDVISEFKCLPILAHIDTDKGFFKEIQGLARDEFFEDRYYRILEVSGEIPQYYTDKIKQFKKDHINTPFVFINHSDFHSEDQFALDDLKTWIKMGIPTLSNLSQIITSGEKRISRDKPKEFTGYLIKSLKISDGFLKNVEFNFSTGLNCIIGGRGTGKSIIIDCIKYIFEDTKVSDTNPLLERLYETVRNGSTISLHIRREDRYYKLQRVVDIKRTTRKDKHNYKLNECKTEIYHIVDTELISNDDLNPKDLMPEIYSQGEVERLQDRLDKQIRIIDNYNLEETSKLQNKIKDNKRELIANRILIMEKIDVFLSLKDKIKPLDELKKELKDLEDLVEDSDVKDHHNWQVGYGILTGLKQDLSGKKYQMKIELINFKEIENDTCTKEYYEIKDIYDKLSKDIQEIQSKFNELIEASFNESMDIIQKYEDKFKERDKLYLIRLEENGKNELSYFQRHRLKVDSKIKEITEDLIPEYKECETVITKEIDHREKLLKQYIKTREELTKIRKSYAKQITKQIKGNIQIKLSSTRDYSKAEAILSKNLSHIRNKEEVITTLIEKYSSPQELAKSIKNNSSTISEITDNTWEKIKTIADIDLENNKFKISRISNNVLMLEEELYYDIPRIIYQPHDKYKDLTALSVGERCSAVLTLSMYSKIDKPLVIDQPEDDLDHDFVKNVLIQNLMETRDDRQYIFCTHNQNIPALGDADLIFKMKKIDGCNQAEIFKEGSFEEVISEIIIMEGGLDAFKLRGERYGFYELEGGPLNNEDLLSS